MHTLPDHKNEAHHVFELKMLFLGLVVLLGMMLVIRFGSPSHRMNAEGIYSPAPMYGVQRYPRPISEFLRSSTAAKAARSSAAARRAGMATSARTKTAASRRPEEREVRRTERSPSSTRSSTAASNVRFAPGWFWR